MKFKVSKTNVIFYSLIMCMVLTMTSLFQGKKVSQSSLQAGNEKRVIKCEVPLPNKLVQNLYFMAADLQTAKQMLFNSKQGLFFDNQLFIKTADFNGRSHVVSFDSIHCDSVGKQVSLTSL